MLVTGRAAVTAAGLPFTLHDGGGVLRPKATQSMKTNCRLLLLISLGQLLSQAFDVCGPNAVEAVALTEVEEQEIRQCREQMSRIRNGIVQYYLVNKQLPQ